MPPRRRRALITGASGGIGAAYARRLATDGADVVLVARNAERLASLRAEIGVGAEVLAADLADPEDLARVEARLSSKDERIDLLVNNAGVGRQGRFAELSVEGEDEQIRLNVLALARLTRAVLPGMVERGRGEVVNLSSVAAFLPGPGVATYYATKAYVLSFTESLAEELRGTGVQVQALCPGLTRTDFHAHSGIDAPPVPAFMWQTADEVVEESLAALAKGRVVCVTGVANRGWIGTVGLLPRTLRRRVAGVVGGRR